MLAALQSVTARLPPGARVELPGGRAGVVVTASPQLAARLAGNADVARLIAVLADEDAARPVPELHYVTVARETVTAG